MSTRSFPSLPHFATFVARLAVQGRENHHVLEEAAVHLERRCKEVVGTYDLHWPELAEATKDDRSRKGFAEDEPLLRTGALRDSIEHNVTGDTARVGSNSQIAVYQELGTRSIPPRSFLRLAAMEQEHELVNILRGGLLRHF